MVQAIPGDGKLGQADLINSWLGESLVWVNPNSTPARGKVFPYPLGFSVQLSTIEAGFLGIENKEDQWECRSQCTCAGDLSCDWPLVSLDSW